ncbi:MAG: hypothetical protein K1X91_17185 [Bacteriodetes bacterium]|nr:hypothetical protein [Bacteroidota bacterium]
MKYRVLLLLISLGFSVSIGCLELFAQGANPLEPEAAPPRLYIGPVVGYNKVFQTGNFASFADEARCPTFVDGSGNGFFAGMTAEFLMGDPKNSKSSIIVRALYNSMPSSFTQEGDNLPSLVILNGQQTVIRTSTQHTADIAYTTADVEVMYKFNLGNTPLVIMAGVAPGLVIQKHITQKFKLVNATDASGKAVDAIFVPDAKYSYEDGGKTAIIKDYDIENASGIRFAIKAGVGYEFILKKIFVVPSINYNFGLTNVNTTDSWKVSALQAQVDVRFAL